MAAVVPPTSAATEKQALENAEREQEQFDSPPAYDEKPVEQAPEIQLDVEEESEEEVDEEQQPRSAARTTRATAAANQVQRPSRWRRLLVIIGMLLVFWFISSIRSAQKAQPKVVHASRYSKEYKFRPAASPIITEQLKDGRTRIRGAQPAFRATETAATRPAKKLGKKAKKSGKGGTRRK